MKKPLSGQHDCHIKPTLRESGEPTLAGGTPSPGGRVAGWALTLGGKVAGSGDCAHELGFAAVDSDTARRDTPAGVTVYSQRLSQASAAATAGST